MEKPMSVAALAPSTDSVMDALKQFRLIFKSVKRHFQWVEKQAGISGAQLWALSAVAESPGMRVSELGRAMAIHQSTTSNLVERLVQAGFMRRERASSDQRVVQLHATVKGNRLLKKAPASVRGVLMGGLEKLGPGELDALNAALAELIARMEIKDINGNPIDLSELNDLRDA